jgi:hypothetical protein
MVWITHFSMILLTLISLLLHSAPSNRRNEEQHSNPPQQQPPAPAREGRSNSNRGNSAGGNPPLPPDSQRNTESHEYTTFTLQEYPHLSHYEVTPGECVSFARFLATTQPYLLHKIDFMFQSIPDNTRNLEWEQVVSSLLGTILGNAN